MARRGIPGLVAGAVAALAALPAPAQDLPSCATLEPGAFASDCTLAAGDVRLTFDYGEAGGLTLTQTGPDGAPMTEPLEIDVAGADWPPALEDLTGDGRPELLVGLVSGMVNTDFLVLRAGEDGAFAPAGSLMAPSVDGIEVSDGIVTTTTRDSAAIYVRSATRLGPSGVEPVYDLEIDLAARDCRFLDESGLAAAGLDGAEILEDCRSQDWPE